MAVDGKIQGQATRAAAAQSKGMLICERCREQPPCRMHGITLSRYRFWLKASCFAWAQVLNYQGLWQAPGRLYLDEWNLCNIQDLLGSLLAN